jgi:hypothetical protein
LSAIAVLLDVQMVVMWRYLAGNRVHASLWMASIPSLMIPEDLLDAKPPREFRLVRGKASHYIVTTSTF